MSRKYGEGLRTQITQIAVIPANAGIQARRETLDSGFLRNDEHRSRIPIRIQIPAYWQGPCCCQYLATSSLAALQYPRSST